MPPLLTPGNASQSAWDKFDGGHSRLVGGQFAPQPDFVYSGHGTNDGLNNIPVGECSCLHRRRLCCSFCPARGRAQDAVVTASALAWLSAVRAAAPKAWVFLCVPFGGFKRDALLAAMSKYQSASPDARATVIDLGDEGARGLTGCVACCHIALCRSTLHSLCRGSPPSMFASNSLFRDSADSTRARWRLATAFTRWRCVPACVRVCAVA